MKQATDNMWVWKINETQFIFLQNTCNEINCEQLVCDRASNNTANEWD